MLTVNGRPVVYDVQTSALLDVDPVLAEVLPLYGPFDRDALASALPHHSPAAIAAAVAEIEQARAEEGIFLPPCEVPTQDATDVPAPTPTPRHVVLEVTERCNLRCRYCLYSACRDDVRPHGTRDMTVATAVAALHHVVSHCPDGEAPSISFYGGEPLLALPVIRAVLAEARAHPQWPRVAFAIDTNGMALDDEAADLIATEGLHVQLSLDGPAHLHDRYRRDAHGAGTHALAEDAVRRLLARDRGVARRLSFQATLAPPYDLAAVIEYFADFPPFRDAGVTEPPQVRISAASLAGTGLGTTADWSELQAQMDAARRRFRAACLAGEHDQLPSALANLFDGALLRVHRRPRGALGRRPDAGCCVPGEPRLHIGVDGAFRPCERTRGQQLIGSVGRGFDSAAAALLIRDFRAATGDRCASCWAVRLCAVCFAALPAGGCLAEETCERIRRQCESDLVLYQELLDDGPGSYTWLLSFR